MLCSLAAANVKLHNIAEEQVPLTFDRTLHR